MKKLISVITAAILVLSVFSICVNAEDYPEMQVEVKCKSALLMETETGTVLMGYNADERLCPASVTKIMTLLLISEAVESGKISLEDTVTVSRNAAEKGGSQIWLKEGEQMSVDDLIKASAVASANDACTALGELVAGSDTAFVKMMNDRANELGMNNTHFENCTGLDDTTDNHYTSAYDIALMSREILKHDLILKYTNIWTDTLRNGATELTNTNKLIRFYDGATGLKTGTTSKAGCCISATAKRDGLSLIAVVMGSDNSKDRFNSARAMLDWGFANYAFVTPEPDMSLITDINVLGGKEDRITPVIKDSTGILVPKGKEGSIEQTVELPVDVEAPVEKGQLFGYVIFTLDSDEIARYSLESDREIEKLNFIEKLTVILSAVF
ncbi:MAG: D-alanyl-D-alanine carboxypeptidase [Ruminococcaceae bacterium]|nr:D-alanyl-D-alanine carboxypeptidase [Oscillospiraceae bacterium]